MECYVNPHCITSDCPDIAYEMCEDAWGYGIPEDLGIERIKCSDCLYNQEGTCEDCLLNGSKDCEKIRGIKDEK